MTNLLLFGTFKQVKLSSPRLHFSLNFFNNKRGFALDMITRRNAGRSAGQKFGAKLPILLHLGTSKQVK